MLTDTETKTIIGELMAAYPSYDWSQATRAIWGRHILKFSSYSVAVLATSLMIEGESAFPSVATLRKYYDVARNANDRDDSRQLALPPDRAYRCHECKDTGFVEDEPDLVHPCPVCQPEQHAKWASGAYAPRNTINRENTNEELAEGFGAFLAEAREKLRK